MENHGLTNRSWRWVLLAGLILLSVGARPGLGRTEDVSGPVIISEIVAATSQYNLNWDSGKARLGGVVAWPALDFDDSAWASGPGPLGFGVSGLGTAVEEQGQASSLYLRKTFTVDAMSAGGTSAVSLKIDYNDGFIAYLNGVEIARRVLGGTGGFVYHDQLAYQTHAAGTAETISLGTAKAVLRAGTNVLAIQVHNAALESSDLYLSAALTLNASGAVQTLVAASDTWKYRPGVAEPSGGQTGNAAYQLGPFRLAWTRLGFDDSLWRQGPGGFGYGDNDDATDASEMINVTASLYLRKTFSITTAEATRSDTLSLSIDYDDGFVAYLNGQEIARRCAGTAGTILSNTALANASHEAGTPEVITLGAASSLLRPGDNVLAIQILNSGTASTDLSSIVNLSLTGTAARMLVKAADPWRYFVGFREPTDNDAAEIKTPFLDWIELTNVSTAPVDLSGWSISDDESNPGQWVFPSGVTLAAGARLVVYASGQDRRTTQTQEPLHTNFKLDSGGGYLALYDQARQTVFSFDAEGYPAQSFFHSYGEVGGGDYRYLDRPTPGQPNQSASWSEILPAVTFSQPHGIYTDALNLALADAEAGVTIRYTLDGSEPTSTTGNLYSTPLAISDNTVVRARAFAAGCLPSPTASASYLFHAMSGSDMTLQIDYQTGTLADVISTNGYSIYPFQCLAGSRLGQSFTATKTFTRVAACQPTWNTTDSSFKLTLRKDGLDGAIIATRTINPAVDNAWNVLTFSAQPAGKYYLEMTDVSGTAGWWGVQSDIYAGGELMVNGHSATEGIQSLPALCYVADAGKDLIEPHGVMAVVGGSYASGAWAPTAIGDYDNVLFHGRVMERPVDLEYLPKPDAATGDTGFTATTGVRMGRSDVQRPGFVRQDGRWDSPSYKWAFRLYSRSDYGAKTIDYPLFADSPGAGPDRVSVLAIRSGNDWKNPFILDELTRRSHAAMNQYAARGTFVNLFINGVFKSYYNLTDRLDENYFQETFKSGNPWDIHKMQVDRTFTSIFELVSGDFQAWDAMMAYATQHDLSVPAYYAEMAKRMDMTNFIDFLLVDIYSGNQDWPWNNWITAREHVAGAPFHFYVWDADLTYQEGSGVNDATINRLEGETSYVPVLYRALKASPEFKLLWQDRVQAHLLTPGGALTKAQLQARLKTLQSIIEPAITNQFSESFDDWIETGWIPNRQEILLSQFSALGLWPPALTAPSFSLAGGAVTYGSTLAISNANGKGTIYYTTDGSDPRVALTGAVASGASTYTSGLSLCYSSIIQARVYDGTNWSPLTAATYQVAQPAVTPGTLIISEFFANAAGNDDNVEWIELYNTTDAPIDINGWLLSDNDDDQHTLNNATALLVPAHGYLVLGSSADQADNGGVSVAYAYGSGFTLGNNGDEIILSQNGTVIHSVGYGAFSNQPAAVMTSLSAVPTAGVALGMGQDYAHGPVNFWRAQTSSFGTGGGLGTPGADNDGVTVGAGDPTPPQVTAAKLARRDFVHVVFNEPVTTASVQTLTHYTLSGAGAPAVSGAALSADGSIVKLTLAGPLLPDQDASLTVSGIQDTAGNTMATQTLPLRYHIPAVVINEIMADDRSATDTEWVELHNTTAAPVDVSGWSLSDDDQYPAAGEGHVTLPAGTILPAQAYVVVNLWNNPDFANRWRLPSSVRVINPVVGEAGALSNGGDNLTLYTAASGGTLVDGSLSVNFPDLAAKGQSLERIDENFAWGDAETAGDQWQAATVAIGCQPVLTESGLPLASQASPGRTNGTPPGNHAGDWILYR